MRGLRVLATAVATVLATRALPAQCPDGRVCSTRSATAPRTVDPPLDDQTWIIVPFTNVTRAADADWLSDASVNLLYLDLSRWRELRVVDDSRVADLVRQLPEGRRVPLSLEAAIAMARRTGAGRLVMGSFVRTGRRTSIAAKVIDVRSNATLRSPRLDLADQDSLMPGFARLAHAVLGVPTPGGFDPTNVGTSSVAAYRAYLSGTRALNHFDLHTAGQELERALSIDSTFALAHYRLAMVAGLEKSADSSALRHAAAASRLSAGLPLRERTLTKALYAFEQGNFPVACQSYRSVLAIDSLDVDGWYGLGECAYHDFSVLADERDTSRFHFRSSWNDAVRAFQRVLSLDPTYHIAFEHILDIYDSELRSGQEDHCLSARDFRARWCAMTAYVLPAGDSIQTVPVPPNTQPEQLKGQLASYIGASGRTRKLRTAEQMAQQWVADAPDESAARFALGHIKLLLGDAQSADAEFRHITTHWGESSLEPFFRDQIEVNVKLHRPQRVHLYIDSLMAVPGRLENAQNYRLLLGQTRDLDSTVLARKLKTTPAAYPRAVVRALLLGNEARGGEAVTSYLDSLTRATPPNTPCPPAYAQMEQISSLDAFWYAPGITEAWLTTRFHCLAQTTAMGAYKALAQKDTGQIRAAASRFYAELRSHAESRDSGTALLVAQLYLTLRDSVAALGVMRWTLDTSFARSSLSPPVYGPLSRPGVRSIHVWPRAALLRADLESAVGDRTAARFWYGEFLDLWNDADAEFRPVVDRARAAYRRLEAGR